MFKMKLECTNKIVKNFWDYYLLKWGMKKKARIRLNTLPDNLVFETSHNLLINHKSLFKALFKYIKDSRLEYDGRSDKFTIYAKDKIDKKEFSADIFSVETAGKAIDISKAFREYDKDLFLVEIDKTRFLIRRRIAADIDIIQETFLDGQYSFIYPYTKEAVIVDIGANIGDTAILFCQKGAKAVYAYEPHPFFFDLAAKNIRLNGLNDKITMKPYGVGAKESIMKIRDDTIFGPTGIFGSKRTDGSEGVDIKIVPLSKIIEDVKNIDVLKMDCEGAEFEAILSCPMAALKKIKVMAIEFHKDPGPIIDYLEKSGFNAEIKKENVTKYGHTGLLFAIDSAHLL